MNPSFRLTTAFVVLLAGPLSSQGHPPWKAGDQPPTVVGLHLGDSRAKLDSILGPADSKQVLGEGSIVLSYPARHVSVSWASLDGVAIIDLRNRDAGEIGGVRVGDTIDSLVARWGQPDRGQDNVGLYLFGWWTVVVRADDTGSRIVMLSLGRIAQ